MLRCVLVAAVSAAAVLVAAPAAVAADLPAYEPAPTAIVSSSNWTGAYVGAQAGYGFGKAKNKGASDTKPDGALVGAYAGYDYQFDGSPVVVGADTDLNFNTNKDRRGGVRNDLQWSGATRGKLGYGMDRVMVYGAAGVAYGGHRIKAGGSGNTDTAVGYTVGGGVEAMVAENVTARAEYRYNDYGKDKIRTGAGSVKSELTENRVTAGLAYKFGGF